MIKKEQKVIEKSDKLKIEREPTKYKMPIKTLIFDRHFSFVCCVRHFFLRLGVLSFSGNVPKSADIN